MSDIIQTDRPWHIPVQIMRLDTIEQRINQALDRVERCVEDLKACVERQDNAADGTASSENPAVIP